MYLETVIDVIFTHFPHNIMIYSRDKLLVKCTLEEYIEIGDFDNLIVDTYEYVNKENKTMLIRVLEG